MRQDDSRKGSEDKQRGRPPKRDKRGYYAVRYLTELIEKLGINSIHIYDSIEKEEWDRIEANKVEVMENVNKITIEINERAERLRKEKARLRENKTDKDKSSNSENSEANESAPTELFQPHKPTGLPHYPDDIHISLFHNKIEYFKYLRTIKYRGNYYLKQQVKEYLKEVEYEHFRFVQLTNTCHIDILKFI